MSLFLGIDASKLYSPRLRRYELNSARIASNLVKCNPLLLMARLCLESAFRDALRCVNRLPSEETRDAVSWIEAGLDWTVRCGRVPPPPQREEYIFSFSWCCSLLDVNPQYIREHGLKRLSGFSHRSDVQLPGVDGIKRHWQEAGEEYTARMAQASEQQQDSVALEQQAVSL